MLIKIRCPNASCGKRLGLRPEFAGKKAKCPACGTIFTVPAASAAPPPARRPVSRPAPPQPGSNPAAAYAEPEAPPYEEHDEQQERQRRLKQRKRERRQQLATVRIGLTLDFVGLICGLVALGLVIIGVVVGLLVPIVIMIFSVLALVLSILGGLLWLVGSILFLWVPHESGAKGWAIAHLVSMFVAPVIMFVISFLAGGVLAVFSKDGGLQGRGNLVVSLIVAIILMFVNLGIGITPWVLLVQFLKRLAYYLRERDVAEACNGLLVFGLAFVFGIPLLAIFLPILDAVAKGGIRIMLGLLVLILFLGALVALVIFLLKHLQMLKDLRDAI